MPTLERLNEMLENCLQILHEVSSNEYIPDLKKAAEKQIAVLKKIVELTDGPTPSFRDAGPQHHGETVGERQEG